jgi:two-component system, OmpR family, phosphate regulon response regulator PhoB
MKLRKITILVIEDEAAIRDLIAFALPQTNFIIYDAENAKQAELVLADHIPDIILLDWMLPEKTGIELIRWLKQEKLLSNIPVIMLTAKAEEESKIKGLEAGADDYITKPFSPKELMARIKAVLRRGPLVSPEGTIKIQKLVMNVDSHEVWIDNQAISLSPIEYRLLYFFVTHANRTYSREQLIIQVWGGNVYIDERTVDVQIRRLRDRLKPFGYERLIRTVRGLGYQLIIEGHEYSHG